MESDFKQKNIMDIKLKYKAWIGEKHADISHRLVDCDIETFAIEFAEHLVKNCYIPNVVGRSKQLKCEDCKFNCKTWDDNHPCASCCDFDNYQAT